jgi:hypothetical protein
MKYYLKGAMVIAYVPIKTAQGIKYIELQEALEAYGTCVFPDIMYAWR